MTGLEASQPTLTELVDGLMIINLTNDELRRLVERGAAAPLLIVPLPTEEMDRAALDAALESYGMVDDSGVTAAFANLWKTVALPDAIVTLERRFAEGPAVWIYGIRGQLIAEQLQSDIGFTWVLATTNQLMGRVLTNGGLLRSTSDSGEVTLDQWPAAEEWELLVSTIASEPEGGRAEHQRSYRYGRSGWRIEGEVVESRKVVATDIAELLETMLLEAAGQIDTDQRWP